MCLFETPTGQPLLPNPVLAQQQQQQYARSRSNEEIALLQAEVAHLKELLLSQTCPPTKSDDGFEVESEAVPAITPPIAGTYVEHQRLAVDSAPLANAIDAQDHPKNRAPRGYYAQHGLFKFFVEVRLSISCLSLSASDQLTSSVFPRQIPELWPFIKETADEWLKPAGVTLKKFKLGGIDDRRAGATLQGENSLLDVLLPPKEDTDVLVAFYLNHVEQLHRLIHVPTFRRDYATFWVPGQPRSMAKVALVLSMLAISTCAIGSIANASLVGEKYRTMPAPWISACERWLRRLSPKHRKLAHYQISCLIYLAKRMNMIHKKRFWTETSDLVQIAIMDGLHRDPSPTTDGPYTIEMKRRIWHVIRELDLQNAYEYGLPTLLHNIDSNVVAPTNIEDDEFDETSTSIPVSKPAKHYTCTSYQSLSARSWKLRLEISGRLFSPAFSKPLDYDDVLRYTHEVTQAMHDLPTWDSGQATSNQQSPLLPHAFLQFQLRECILALHRPYLRRDDSKFWLSENICYHMSRDILQTNGRLADMGVQNLAQLREDLLLASLNLTHITMLQPPGTSLISHMFLPHSMGRSPPSLTTSVVDSTSVTMSDSLSIIELLEQCLPIMEHRYLRSCHSEPFGFLTMCAASLLLKVHLGKEYRHSAKYICAQKFLDLHDKHVGRHQTQHPIPQDIALGQGEGNVCFQKGRRISVRHSVLFQQYELTMSRPGP